MLNVISKSILAYSLSFVLAFAPTLAFARQAKRKSGGFKAEPTRFYEKQEAMGKVAKASKKALSAQRKVASVPAIKAKVFRSRKDAVESMYHKVRYKGENVYVTQVPSKDGKHVLSQSIRGPDFEEIMVDEFGTGTASVWNLKRGPIEMTASHPYKGAFVRLQIRERREKAYLVTKLLLNPDFKTYRVASYRVEPFTIDHDVVGNKNVIQDKTEINTPDLSGVSKVGLSYYQCVDQLSDKSGINALQRLLSGLQHANQTVQDGLTCDLQAFEKGLLDKSCFDPKFKDSAKDIVTALAQIYSSVNSKPSRYLQCANDHHFAYYAAKMQSNFVSDYNHAESLVPSRTLRERDSGGSSHPDCSPIEQGVTKTGADKAIADIDATEAGFTKPFKCDDSIKTDGLFHNDDTQQIVLGLNSEKMAKEYQTNAADAYASVIFHEMLHQSGIPEEPLNVGENLVSDVQSCCADSDPNSQSSRDACARIDKNFAQQSFRQDQQNDFDIHMAGSLLMQRDAQSALGPTGGDDLMARWYGSLENDPKYSKAKEAYEKLKACEAAPNADRAACVDAASPALRKFSDTWFNSDCQKYRADSHMTASALNCDALKRQFHADLSSEDSLEQMKASGAEPIHGVVVNKDVPASMLMAGDGRIDHHCQYNTSNCNEWDAAITPPAALELRPVDTSALTVTKLKLPKISAPTTRTASRTANAGTQSPTGAVRTAAENATRSTQNAVARANANQNDVQTNGTPSSNSSSLPTIGGTADEPSNPNSYGDNNSDSNGNQSANNSNASNSNGTGDQSNAGNSNAQYGNSAPTNSSGGYIPTSSTVSKVALTSSRSMPTSLTAPTASVPVGSQEGQQILGGTTNGTPLTQLVKSAASSAASVASFGATLSNSAARVLTAAVPAYAQTMGRAPASVNNVVATSGGGGPSSSSRRSASLASGRSSESSGSGEGDQPSQGNKRGDQDDQGDKADQQSQVPQTSGASTPVPMVTKQVMSAQTVGEKIVALSGLGEKGFRDHLALGSRSPIIGPLLAQRWTIVDTPSGKRLKPPGNGNTCYEPDRSRALRPVSCNKSR